MYRWNKNKGLNIKSYSSFFAYVALFAALISMALFGVCTPRQSRYVRGVHSLSDYVAKVGSEKIYFKEFYNTYQNAYEYYQKLYKGEFNPSEIRLAFMVLNELISETLSYILAKQNGLVIGDEEIETQIFDAFKDSKGKFSGEYFEQTLKALGYTEAEYIENLKRRLLQYKFLQELQDSVKINDFLIHVDYVLKNIDINLEYVAINKDSIKMNISQKQISEFLKNSQNLQQVQEYYNKNLTEFKEVKQVKARHLLVSYEGARMAPSIVKGRTKEQALQRAKEILIKIKASPKDFTNFVKQYTDEANAKSTEGLLGFFAYEDMVKEFSDVAFNLKIGEISDVVETPFGFHIIKVEDIKQPKDISFEEAKYQIAKKFIEREQKDKITQEKSKLILQQLLGVSNNHQAQSNILKKYDLKWQETGDFKLNSRDIPQLGNIDNIQDIVLSFKNSGDIYPKIVESGNVQYIFKLKSLKYPEDWESLSKDKKDELLMSLKQRYSNKVFMSFKKVLADELESKGKIWKSQNILSLDVPQDVNANLPKS